MSVRRYYILRLRNFDLIRFVGAHRISFRDIQIGIADVKLGQQQIQLEFQNTQDHDGRTQPTADPAVGGAPAVAPGCRVRGQVPQQARSL